MTRPLRIEFENAFYHVMNRGRARQNIFIDEHDYQSFIRTLEESFQLFKLEVHAYCLMSNHYHLLLKTPEGNLSRAMRHVGGLYTQRFNRYHQTDGPLFRGRYKAILIDSDAYLLQLSKYIHLNPVEAGIVKEPGQYVWSSYSAYTGKTRTPEWLVRDEVFAQLNVTVRRKSAYRKFVELQGDIESIKEFYNTKRLAPVMGDENFRAISVSKADQGTWHSEITHDERVSLLPRPPLASVVQEVARVFNVSDESIYTLRKGRGIRNTPRRVAMYLAQRICGLRLTEIAEAFGLKHYGGASHAIQAIKKEAAEDRKLAKRIKNIVKRFDP